jgi:DNA-binding LytR/AlgR family response regulator
MEQKAKFKEQKKKIIFFKKNLKMRIAICDSDSDYLKKLKNLLYRYSNSNKMEFIVEEFSSGEQLLKSKNNYCLIFIEYNLCGINGFETAKTLRSKGIESEIIFLSQNTDFIFESFKVSPYRFFKKPLETQVLFETLNDFFISYSENYPLWITNQINTYCLNTKDIYYLEADNKHCFVHLKNEAIPCNKTMARVFSTLPQKYFKKINRAFIVNLNYISSYNNEFVLLNNGENIHISRKYYKYFKQEYFDFAKPKIP